MKTNIIRIEPSTKEKLQALVENIDSIQTFGDAVEYYIRIASEKSITEDIEEERDRTIHNLEFVMQRHGTSKREMKEIIERTHSFFSHLIPILNGKVRANRLVIEFKKEGLVK